MAITTYAELQSSIANWLNRDDLTAVIPDFISLAGKQIERELRHFKMINRATATIDSRYSQLPSDWLETVRFHITSGTTYRLELISLDDMVEYRQNNSNTSGTPRFYAHVGDSVEIYPSPDGSYDTEMMYYQSIPALSDSNTSNWVLELAPDAYLYGARLQAAPYLADDARSQVWGGLYSGAVNSLQSSSDQSKYSGSGIRMRVTSY